MESFCAARIDWCSHFHLNGFVRTLLLPVRLWIVGVLQCGQVQTTVSSAVIKDTVSQYGGPVQFPGLYNQVRRHQVSVPRGSVPVLLGVCAGEGECLCLSHLTSSGSSVGAGNSWWNSQLCSELKHRTWDWKTSPGLSGFCTKTEKRGNCGFRPQGRVRTSHLVCVCVCVCVCLCVCVCVCALYACVFGSCLGPVSISQQLQTYLQVWESFEIPELCRHHENNLPASLVNSDLHCKVFPAWFQLAPPFSLAVDVGCGTGISTRPWWSIFTTWSDVTSVRVWLQRPKRWKLQRSCLTSEK